MSASLIRKILNGRRIPLTYHQKQPFHASLSTHSCHSRYFSRYFITTQPVSQTENVISAVIGSIEPSSGRRTEEAHDTTTEESFWSKWSAYFKQKFSSDWFLHLGYVLGGCGMMMENVLLLRSFSVVMNAGFALYATRRPVPLKSMLYWSIAFIAGHSIMIIRLLMENRSVHMSDTEHEVFCNAFYEHGFTPYQFRKIMKKSKFMSVDPGDIICYRNAPRNKTMYVLGAVELQQNGASIGGFINGFVGDLVPNNDGTIEAMDHGNYKKTEAIVSDTVHLSDVAQQTENVDVVPITIKPEVKASNISSGRWEYTVVALEACKIFVWDSKELHAEITSNPRLISAAIRTVGGDLRSKLNTAKNFSSIKAYRQILEIVMCDGSIDAQTKSRLNKFRERNNITQKEHEAMVTALEWTLEEYDKGIYLQKKDKKIICTR
eukprot:294629_1